MGGDFYILILETEDTSTPFTLGDILIFFIQTGYHTYQLLSYAGVTFLPRVISPPRFFCPDLYGCTADRTFHLAYEFFLSIDLFSLYFKNGRALTACYFVPDAFLYNLHLCSSPMQLGCGLSYNAAFPTPKPNSNIFKNPKRYILPLRDFYSHPYLKCTTIVHPLTSHKGYHLETPSPPIGPPKK